MLLGRFRQTREGLKLNCTYQLWVYVDGVNTFGGNIHTTKKNTKALAVASKEIGLELNAEKTKYMVISRDQHEGQNHNTKIANKSFEKVEQFRCLGTTLTNQNSIHEEIQSRLKSGNAGYDSPNTSLQSQIYEPQSIPRPSTPSYLLL
jgi:hypothetical protein